MYNLIIVMLFFLLQVLPAQSETLTPDLVIMIDVSGSMKHNDPEGERGKALQLLLNLVPMGSAVTLIAFATHPHELSHQEALTEAGRQQALAQQGKIDNHGQWTDIDAALNAGFSRLTSTKEGRRKHLILLTDGFVELGHGSAADQSSRQQIWTKEQARAQQMGIHIHAIDLGGQADDALLRHLSLGTGGRFVRAHDKELSKIFLQILDVAAPQQRIPFKGKTFSSDAGVRELTLLDFRSHTPPGVSIPALELLTPSQQHLTAQDHPATVRWVHAAQYDIVTVSRPEAGVWQMSDDPGPDSRVTILSDLNLEVKGVPTNAAPDTAVHLTIDLLNKGRLIVDPDFLMLTSLYSVSGKVGELWPDPLKIYDGPVQGSVMAPDDGIFHQELQGYHQPGDYVVRVLLKGSTFTREFDQLMHVTGHPSELPPPVVHKDRTVHQVPAKAVHGGPAWWLLVLIGLLIIIIFGALGFLGFIAIHKMRLRNVQLKKDQAQANASDPALTTDNRQKQTGKGQKK